MDFDVPKLRAGIDKQENMKGWSHQDSSLERRFPSFSKPVHQAIQEALAPAYGPRTRDLITPPTRATHYQSETYSLANP